MSARQHNEKALTALIQQAISEQQHHWIKHAAILADTQQHYQLAMSTVDNSLKKILLRAAGKKGHADSQYQFAMQYRDGGIKLRELEKAAEQGQTQAILDTYYLAVRLHKVDLARRWEPQAALLDHSIAIAYANRLWKEQGAQSAISFLQNQQLSHMPQVQNILQIINLATVQTSAYPANQFSDNSCVVKLQLIASTIPAIKKALSIITKYTSDARFQHLPVCVFAPVWLEYSQLSCSNDPEIRLNCQLAPLSALAKQINFSHAIVIGQQGIANVNNGLMYLDENDDYTVFLHEFAHFAGFIDEYPIKHAMAEQFCTPGWAPNLVFQQQIPKLNDTHFGKYSQYHKTLKITEAQTCKNMKVRAYKPVDATTFMEHHDIGNIPDIYIQIWQERLSKPIVLTPIFVNFAQWHDQLGESEKAQYWWQKYEKFRL
jgi:hypothetical protein